jgi:hypothetical protein
MAWDEDHLAKGSCHTCVACAGEACVYLKAWAVGKQGWETVSDGVSAPSLRLSGRAEPIHDIGGNSVRFLIPRVLTPESE